MKASVGCWMGISKVETCEGHLRGLTSNWTPWSHALGTQVSIGELVRNWVS